jgi:hypothetical protein
MISSHSSCFDQTDRDSYSEEDLCLSVSEVKPKRQERLLRLADGRICRILGSH